jgi:hypothetical protein
VKKTGEAEEEEGTMEKVRTRKEEEGKRWG